LGNSGFQNWFFANNPVSFELFSVLFFVLGLYFDHAYSIEEKIFGQIQDGG
jgi:hypothetical protein